MNAVDEQALAGFPPAFAAFGATLRLPQPAAVPVPGLLRPTALAKVMATYATSFPGGDRRAILSMWSQHYLLALVPAVSMSALLSPCDPPVAIETTGVVLSKDGRPIALCLPGRGAAAVSPCPAMRLTPLLRDHMEPLAAALATAGLPSRVFWSNAVAVLDWTLRIALAPPHRTSMVARGSRAPGWIDGRPNPLFHGVGTAAKGGGRAACCLRHRLPSAVSCPDCPRRTTDAGNGPLASSI